MRCQQLSLLLLLSFAGSAAYADTTYNINYDVGGATAIGTLTTDGRLGSLQSGNVLDFTVTLRGGGNSAVVSGTNAFITGNDLIATADGLFYNFNNTAQTNFAYLVDASGNELCITGSGSCPGGPSQGGVIQLDGTTYSRPGGGTAEVATAAPGSAVTPEPSSLALLGTGVLGVLGAARRRFAQSFV